MPSPKPVRTAAAGATEIELASIGSSSSGASGRPWRRSSLLKSNTTANTNTNTNESRSGRPQTSSTAASTATALGTTHSRLAQWDKEGSGDDDDDDDDDDNWGDAWGEDFGDEGHAGGRDDDQTLFEDDYGSGGGSGSDQPQHSNTDEELGLGLGPHAAGRRQQHQQQQQQQRRQQQYPVGEDFGFGDGRLSLGDAQSSLIVASLTEDERKEADKHVVLKLLYNGSLIGLWYLFSLSISLYNKWMFGSNFPFPLFTTSIHMLVQFVLACVVLYFVPSLRPPRHNEKVGGGDEPAMTRWFYFTRIGPCGAATGLDIGLGNASLKLITLTFYTMCKSSSLAFVLLFAFAFRLEKPTLRLVAIIATMTIGVVMMVAGEVEFDTFGFFLVISAAFFSGFRWGLTQIMLLRNPATSNPFSSIFYLAPVMFVTLFVLAIPMEGFPALVQGFRELADKFGAVRTPLLILFPGTIAFLMTASEFALLQRTSVVTLSIAGIFKEVVTITTATLVFHDTLTLVNMLGLVVTMAAIVVYNYIKITKMRQVAQIEVHKGHQHQQHQQQDEGLQSSTGPTQFGPGLGSSSQAAAEHDDSDAEGDNDAEDAGLLRR
ncbi:hypothetical protein SCUCBS95973_008568 [Sporothrix curviconia]|uniref:Sugar phosphate transporter domain-containing protein n=1 Tax=Sporothrix curviconia TaxID=1260050 RepID=A0ABP0CQR2_9PEZI